MMVRLHRSEMAAMPPAASAAVPASWPAGVSHLAQAFVACRGSGVVQADWLARPNAMAASPAFFAQPPQFSRARQPKERD